MFPLTCLHCGKKLLVKEELAGKKVRCPECKQTVEAPPAEGVTVAPGCPPERSEEATLPPTAPVAPYGPPAIGPRGEDIIPPASGPTEIVNAGSSYEVSSEIARGGMGAIMRAVDRDIQREVAVKFLLNQADAKLKARFVEEAQITGQLEHPNIVPIHQLGVHEDGRCFFSMKMVKGRSLSEILKDDRSDYTLGSLLSIFVSICNALSYAHWRQVIHRDLKPANIMIGDFGEVYVMDWGLAKVLGKDKPAGPKASSIPIQRHQSSADTTQPARPSAVHSGERVTTHRHVDGELTQAGSILGTPAYMPPEQAQSEDVDERADIYSLGAILYEIMTLTPPVGKGGDMMAILMRVAEGRIDAPEKRAPRRAQAGWIPPELSAIALKALARDRQDRYQSVEALKHDIQLFLEGRSVSAKQDTAWEMFQKLVKRNKGASAATAAALVVLVVVVGLAFHFNNQERIRAQAARVKAEDNYQAFLKEQGEKEARTKVAAPALVRAARLLTSDKQFDAALAQVNVALDYDPGQTEAYLLKGQLLIGLERYQEAAVPLAEFLKREPGNPLIRQLADLAGKPEPNKGAYLWALWEVFDKQKAYPLADRMTHLAERFAGPNKELLTVYRKRIDAAWPGFSSRLSIDKNGDLNLNLSQTKQARDLSPLKGMKLSSLNLYLSAVQDLEPLRGMPLTRLDLAECKGGMDLGPLKGMKLTYLNLKNLSDIATLESLRGMPLTFLNLHGCEQLEDLEPLRGMPLATLILTGNSSKIRSIEPLASLKSLTKLTMSGLSQVKDLGPLRGLPLTELEIWCNNSAVRDLEPLRGMPLTSLRMGGINLSSLDFLKGMPLTDLSLIHWSKIRDLEVLRGMRITWLDLTGCSQVKDFTLLKEMPLTYLILENCKQIQDLEFVRGLKLQYLNIRGVPKVKDLSPLAGMELKVFLFTPGTITTGLDIVRGMKSLDLIELPGNRRFEPAEFWKLYDRGEFK